MDREVLQIKNFICIKFIFMPSSLPKFYESKVKDYTLKHSMHLRKEILCQFHSSPPSKQILTENCFL